MNVAALLLVGGATLATAGETRINMLPLPKTLPQVFFAPDSLAGNMLEPLVLPKESEAAEPATVAPGIAPGQAVKEPEPAAGLTTAAVPVAAEAEVATQAPAEPEPEAAQEPEPEPAKPAPATTVHVIVENVESNSGTVNVAVCDTGFSPEGCPYQTAVPAARGFVEAQFTDVPPGDYAVVGYHDVNNNDEFDKFLGVPREPYALSGKAAAAMVPKFSDAVLKINKGENYVIIRMKRLGSG